jgi:uncharacterized membrane protein YedE/YeeE
VAQRRQQSRGGQASRFLIGLVVAGVAVGFGAWLAGWQGPGWGIPGIWSSSETIDEADRRALDRVVRERGND